LALDRGETDLALLQLSASLGDEVRAWNALLQERKETRTSSTSTNLKEGLRRTQSGGNLFAACDALPSGLMVVDANEIVRFANGAAAVMLRLSKPDLAGDPLATLINDERVTAAVRDLLKSDRRRRSTLDIEREDAGSKSCLRFNIRPLRKDDGGGVVITIEDTTQTRAAEAARDTFIAQATHELRTPLTNIRLYTEAAIDAGEDDKLTRTKSLNVINNECRRLERIVGDMLSVSEIEAGSFKIEYAEVRLDAMMDEVAHDFRAQAKEKGVELFFHLPPKLPQARADRDKLVIAIQNLIGNAIKYTPAGGRVDVTVEASARTFTVAVKDTGIGIAPDDVSRLFERFYRASDERVRTITGTGLGLALAREVIRLHGGDVTVESELNKGSTFTLSMPLTAEVAQPC
jgi:two-component system sensor histidine kinase VicK